MVSLEAREVGGVSEADGRVAVRQAGDVLAGTLVVWPVVRHIHVAIIQQYSLHQSHRTCSNFTLLLALRYVGAQHLGLVINTHHAIGNTTALESNK